MPEMITITGLRQIVSKKSKGEQPTKNEIECVKRFMQRLDAQVKAEHKNCCNECVTKAVWFESLKSYDFIIGAEYER